MVSVSRDKEGKFIKSSPYGQKLIATRLLKSDEEKILKQAEEKGVSTSEIARIAITEWLKNNG